MQANNEFKIGLMYYKQKIKFLLVVLLIFFWQNQFSDLSERQKIREEALSKKNKDKINELEVELNQVSLILPTIYYFEIIV